MNILISCKIKLSFSTEIKLEVLSRIVYNNKISLIDSIYNTMNVLLYYIQMNAPNPAGEF